MKINLSKRISYMMKYLIKLILLVNLTAFVFKDGAKLYVSSNTKRHMSDVMVPIDPEMKIAYGGGGNEIQVLTNREAEILMDMWTMNPFWENKETTKFTEIIKRNNSNDIFLGYAPELNKKNRIIYLFHARVEIHETSSNISVPCLEMLSGVSCPFDGSGIVSFKFKELVQEAISIVPIDFKPLLHNPKFRLSWDLFNKNLS